MAHTTRSAKFQHLSMSQKRRQLPTLQDRIEFSLNQPVNSPLSLTLGRSYKYAANAYLATWQLHVVLSRSFEASVTTAPPSCAGLRFACCVMEQLAPLHRRAWLHETTRLGCWVLALSSTDCCHSDHMHRSNTRRLQWLPLGFRGIFRSRISDDFFFSFQIYVDTRSCFLDRTPHYHYNPSRPPWLLGGTLRLSSLLTPERAVPRTTHLGVSPHLPSDKEIYLLRDYRPTYTELSLYSAGCPL